MPGLWINHRQVEVYMKSREKGYTQIASASRAGISERSGREIEHGRHQDARKKNRHWRTRPDPLAEVWESELLPLLEKTPNLQAITLLEYLQDQWPNRYPDSLLRTLQRRVKQWRAVEGPEKEVMFRQEHPPGAQGLSDFTTLKNVRITIRGEELNHILYHFRLSFSHWSYMRVTLGGESYTALAEGLQCALWRLGGSPFEHRTDSLSAAYKNLSRDEKSDITSRYETFCRYYNMQPTRNNRGKSHENGSIESAHRHLKRRIEQALLLRGSNDFEDLSAYQAWLDDVVSTHNCRNAKALHEEQKFLQPLPENKTMDYTDLSVVVTSSSTIDVRRVTYSVPAKLIGECLRVRLYDDRLELFVGSDYVCQLNRIYPVGKASRARLINYKHVIHSLIKKPHAFKNSRIRDDLLPTDGFKKIWAYTENTMTSKSACRFMVGLLALAAKLPSERPLENSVLLAIKNQKVLVLSEFELAFLSSSQAQPVVCIQQHSLQDYNQLVDSRGGN